MSRFRRHLNYANVMATIAVFVALGGGAYAAIKLPANSVGTKQLKKNAVKTKKIAKNAVKAPKIAAGAVKTAKIGDGAVTGAKIANGAAVKRIYVREEVTPNLATNAHEVTTIQCDPGDVAIGGGATGTGVGTRNFGGLDIDTVVEAFGPTNSLGQASADGESPTGWHVSTQVKFGPRDVHLYAVCADL